MTAIRQRPFLLADTGPFCRFAEGKSQQILALADYLEEAVHIVQDVSIELSRRAKTPERAALNQLQWIDPKFPQHEPIAITDKRVLAQIEDILAGRRRRNPGHFMEDGGEVATILVAKDRGWPVLMDDGWDDEASHPQSASRSSPPRTYASRWQPPKPSPTTGPSRSSRRSITPAGPSSTSA